MTYQWEKLEGKSPAIFGLVRFRWRMESNASGLARLCQSDVTCSIPAFGFLVKCKPKHPSVTDICLGQFQLIFFSHFRFCFPFFLWWRVKQVRLQKDDPSNRRPHRLTGDSTLRSHFQLDVKIMFLVYRHRQPHTVLDPTTAIRNHKRFSLRGWMDSTCFIIDRLTGCCSNYRGWHYSFA